MSQRERTRGSRIPPANVDADAFLLATPKHRWEEKATKEILLAACNSRLPVGQAPFMDERATPKRQLVDFLHVWYFARGLR